MAPRWVKKRDGRIVPFDEGRIVRSVLRAGRRHGTSDELERLAREIARSVTLFLGKNGERAPETASLAQAMEEALEETGHAAIAQSARDWRDWRRRRQAEVRVREATPPAPGGAAPAPERPSAPVEVVSRSAARPWTKQRIVEALTQQAELEREAAEDVARAVEERVFAAGLNQISTTLLRELIDAELFERGFSAQLGRLEVLGLPKQDLQSLASVGPGRAPLLLEDAVTRAALERYALDELVVGAGATAHLRGDLHLRGLGRPFRMAAGAVDVGQRGAGAATSPLAAVRSVIQVARRGCAAHELCVGVVGLDGVLAAYPAPARDEAVELLLDALVAPAPDDVPPAPEVVLVVEAAAGAGCEGRREAVLGLVSALERRGKAGAGVRLVLRARGPEPELAPLLGRVARGALAGGNLDLALGDGEGAASRGMVPFVTTVQVGLLNLAGLALAAGRGERRRLSLGIERAVEAALDACHRRRRLALASVARPAALPLFGGPGAGEPQGGASAPTLGGVPLQEVGDALGVVGLDAALRYLTGEGPTENPRVAELARELLAEVAEVTAAAASRLGLGRVGLEDVPAGDAGLRLAGLDLDRFADARDLLGDAPGWDVGAAIRPGPEPYADLRLRLRLARSRGAVLVLPRPVLAEAPDPDALAATLVDGLRRPATGRHAERSDSFGAAGRGVAE